MSLLRFRALRGLRQKYAAYIDNPYLLDYKQAQEVMQLSLLHDMPFLFVFGTQWALVKSYGIASGTPLLVKTRQLADPSKVGKRAEDTAVFISEFLAGDLDSERGRLAMAKLNWMHRRYQILDTDYVHTLALFVLEPQRWIEKYEWRSMTYLEKVAHFLYWREIGHRMGFGGIPETLEELMKWKAEYEKTHLYFVESNKIVTDATVNLFLRSIPKVLRGFIKTLFVSFIDEKEVRVAIGYPDPPAWAVFLTSGFFRLRGLVIRHFFLPRAKKLDPLGKPGPDGRLYRSVQFVGFEPWYVADTWYNRLGMWLKSGGRLAPGESFQSRGFLPEELGPAGFEKMSREPVKEQAKALEEYVRNGGSQGAGCPFNFGW
ncbi:hypothetical protein GQ53DRAFT_869641 [Thozetella sp. PMI_491]|nr:hypothetical protein GQ53DRAFT_869641 [Thozetella sp. PMI_491]